MPRSEPVRRALGCGYTVYVQARRRFEKRLGRIWYGLVYRWPSYRSHRLHNGGFLPLDPDLQDSAESEKNQIQLYLEVLKAGGLAPSGLDGRSVLEVGAGRGGGLLYLARRARPRLLTGVEQSGAAVRRGRRDGVDLRRALAEHLPFADAAFDHVLCVDSMNVFSDLPRCMAEIERVLAPGGTVLVGDFILGGADAARERLDRWIAGTNLVVTGFRDVTGNVSASMREDNQHRLALLGQLPSWLRPHVQEFFTVEGTERYRRWQTGAYSYYLAVLQRAPT